MKTKELSFQIREDIIKKYRSGDGYRKENSMVLNTPKFQQILLMVIFL